jgi:hypothetical protein
VGGNDLNFLANVFLFVFLLILPLQAAESPGRKIPLRYPFGLTAQQSPKEVQNRLQAKGLKPLAAPSGDETATRYFQMAGQISYEDFKPVLAEAAFERNQLASFTLSSPGYPDCTAAASVYASAVAFLQESYATPRGSAAFSKEPASDILDCGPHFNSEDYRLQLETKDFIGTVTPVKKRGRYTVLVTYQSRALLEKSIQENQDRNRLKEKSMLENL